MMRPASIALASLLLLAGSARAQAPAAPPAAPAAPAALPKGLEKPAAASPVAPSETDRQIQEAVQREVAKMREQLRDEMRAEIQGAQSAAEFLGEQEEKKKLQLLELNGYFRFRYDLFVNLAMGRELDPMGYYLWLGNSAVSPYGTQTSANMRLKVEPTFNVSEQVRIKAEIDILDNVVLGSTPVGPNWNQIDYTNWSQVPPTYGYNANVNAIVVKRAWGEVQTPIGLLSFGRMPSSWGMGIYANAGGGLDQEFGDSVDRIQFAIPIGVLGGLAVVPYYDWAATGITSESLYLNVGLGQPVNVTQDDDAGALGIKIAREDTPEQVRRKLEKGQTSLSYGLLFNYKTQRFAFPSFSLQQRPSSGSTPADPYAMVKRDASSVTFDLFGRLVGKRFELEAEAVGIFGSVANMSLDPATAVGPVDLQMGGGALRGKYKLGESGKFVLGLELGAASGDKAPALGNLPGRSCDYRAIPVVCTPPPAGSIDGQQWSADDLNVNNYRFNPAYQVDLILWRRVLGTVTDAWYVKPSFRWDILDGLSLGLQLVYSQAIYPQSTPSTDQKPLGVELDVGVRYKSDDGFVFFLEYGVLQPMNGLAYVDKGAGSLSRAQNLHGGLGIVF